MIVGVLGDLMTEIENLQDPPIMGIDPDLQVSEKDIKIFCFIELI